MSLSTDLAADFDAIKDDFGVSVTFSGSTAAFTAVKNTLSKEIVYAEVNNKSVEYKFTLWVDTQDFTDASISVPANFTEATVGGVTYLIAQQAKDPLDRLVSFDMVEQYG